MMKYLKTAFISLFLAFVLYLAYQSSAPAGKHGGVEIPSLPPDEALMAEAPAFDGCVMPVEGVSYQKGPSPSRIPLDTVWCGSYYYFPKNYKAAGARETEIYATRATGSGSHPGVDIAVPVGTPVKAVAAGTVILAGWREGWGNLLVIAHQVPGAGKLYSVYGHLSGFIKTGGMVKRGEFAGYSGASGSPYPHLHFQIDRNPFPYYPSSGGAYPYTSPLHPVNRLEEQEQVKKNTCDPLLFVKEHPAAAPGKDASKGAP
ncbi:MAG: M23 family metallopeptidase [Candidatus Eremiobacteraeota bacterium]|nr:M23 family metallopeptidase [Candidatus Eremiobacteraeota bacterium]